MVMPESGLSNPLFEHLPGSGEGDPQSRPGLTGPGPGGGLEKEAVVLIQQRTKLGQEMWGRQRQGDQGGAMVKLKLASHSAGPAEDCGP